MKQSYLDMFIEDCKYYDLKRIELKTILKNLKLSGKTILDIGAGTGRLAFPLARYAKEVIALDSDKRLKVYFKEHKKKNIVFINKTLEEYLKNNKKFDIILLAWPTINLKFISLIKKLMKKDSIFILITCDNNSDWETIVNRLGVVKRNYFDKDIQNKMRFLSSLPKRFKVLFKRKIKTKYLYPNSKIAFRIIKNDMLLWFNIRLNKKTEESLRKLIEKHKRRDKIIFGEIIHFYILKLK